MTSDFTGFNFLASVMQSPMADAKRGYATGSLAVPSTTGTASVVGSVASVDTTTGNGLIIDKHLFHLTF